MARTIISRKGNKPLRIVNRFSDGGDVSNLYSFDKNLHVDVPSVGETAMRNRTKPFSEKFNEFQSGNIGTGLQKGINAFNALSSLQAGEMPSVFALNNFDYSQAGPQGSVYQAIDETAQLLGGISNLTKKKRKPLSDIVGLAAYGGNLYAGGGLVGTALSGVTSAVANGIQQAKIADTSELKKGIINQGNAQINASNYDDLQNAWAQRTTMNHISAKDLRNKSVFDDVLNSFSGSAQGAATGAAIASGISSLKNQNSAAYGGNIYPMNNRYNKYGFGGDIAGGIIGGVGSLIGSFIGRSKANKEAKRVNQLVDAMNTRNYMSYVNNANNIEAQNDLSMMANYAALGGPIYPYNTINTMGLYNTGDALGWGYLQDRLSLAQQKIENEENNKNDKENNLFASGGGIHINPKNKGKLTATAKRTGKSFSELAHSKNPLTRKRAIFALNARKWHHGKKHALGGDLQSNGADWDLGFTTIGNGGTHEMNPNEGVQMSMDNQGIPNLVEQGEVIFDNYVFSNRLAPSKEILKQFKLPVSFADRTFAQIAELISSEVKERPNDPISKNGLQANMQKLLQAQELIKKQEQDRRTREAINNMSPEELQGLMAMANQGMQQQAQDQAMQEQAAQEQMMAQQGIDPNALGAEALYGAYGGRLIRRFDEGGDKSKKKSTLVAQLSQEDINKIMEKLTNLGNSSINLDALNKFIKKDENGNWVSVEEFEGTPTQVLSSWYKSIGNAGDLTNIPELTILRDYNNALEHPEVPMMATWMQYAPFVGDLGNLIYTYTHKPNMDYANAIQAAADAAGQYSPIGYNPIGDYLQYTPQNTFLPLAENAAITAGNTRNYLNLSNANRGTAAAFLAANTYNSQLGNAKLLEEVAKLNQEQKQKVREFNRGTNLANSQMALEAAKANQSARQAALNSRLSGTYYAQAMKNELDKDYQDRKRLAWNRIPDDLGILGERNVSLNRERTDPANLGMYFTASGKGMRTPGTLYPYLSLFGNDNIINPETQTAIGSDNVEAFGGNIKRNRRRRRNHG